MAFTVGRIRSLGHVPRPASLQDVIDARLELHREQREGAEPTIDVLLLEAFAIADGKGRQLGSTAHVTALVHYIRSLAAEHEATIQHLLRDGEP